MDASASDQSRLPDIEELTFTQALYEYSRQREAFGDCKLFINSIPNQLISPEVEKHLLEQYPTAGRLVIEIMESEQADGEIMREKHEMAGRLGADRGLMILVRDTVQNPHCSICSRSM